MSLSVVRVPHPQDEPRSGSPRGVYKTADHLGYGFTWYRFVLASGRVAAEARISDDLISPALDERAKSFLAFLEAEDARLRAHERRRA